MRQLRSVSAAREHVISTRAKPGNGLGGLSSRASPIGMAANMTAGGVAGGMAADVSDAELLAGWTEDGLMEAARAEGYADAASSSSIEGAQAATPNPIASFSFGGKSLGKKPKSALIIDKSC